VQSAVRRAAAEASTVEEFHDAVDERIVGIAAAQDLILKHENESVPLTELVARQLATFVRSTDKRVAAEGPPLELGPAATHSLSLALHELATNACKYGALSRAEGRLAIEWRAIGGDDGRFLMFWTERGGPRVEPPKRKGFGRRVVEQMVAQSLGGDVDLRFEPEGLVWRLEAPLKSLGR
jgi:two-component sensor histidine kinase